MNFKTKDDIIKSTQSNISPFQERHFNNGVKEGVDESFKSFAERIEFYQKYEDRNWDNLTQPEEYIREKLVNTWTDFNAKQDTGNEIDFDVWLYNHCFGNMIK